jgi:CheY-like chemotaxis protein
MNEPSLIASTLSGIYVLVVEDNEDARMLAATLLTLAGAQVVAAASVSEAMEAFERLTPDVLVSDINMPNEDGYDLIRKVRARSPEKGGTIPAVAVTGHGPSEERERALTAGFQEFLAKPIAVTDLISTIARVIGRAGER